MKLEQKLYIMDDLKNLSASILYTGHLPPMGPGGFGVLGGKDNYGDIPQIFTREGTINGKAINGHEPLKVQPSSDLTIRDFPGLRFQMHIHEGETDKPSSLMDYSRKKVLISSYDAAMADAGKPAYDAMETVEKMLKMNPFLKGLFEKDNSDEE